MKRLSPAGRRLAVALTAGPAVTAGTAATTVPALAAPWALTAAAPPFRAGTALDTGAPYSYGVRPDIF